MRNMIIRIFVFFKNTFKEILILSNTYEIFNWLFLGRKKISKKDFLIRQNKYKSTIEKLRVKFNNNKKIKIYFVIYDYSIWQVDSLFFDLLKLKHFSIGIVHIPLLIKNTSDFRKRYIKTDKFCKSKSDNIFEAFDVKNYRWKSIEELKILNIDLLIYTHTSNSPFEASSTGEFLLPLYVPYGIMAASNKGFLKKLKFENFQFNKSEHNFMFCNILETKLHLYLKNKYSTINSINSVVCGYPKLDNYFKLDILYNPWKNCSQKYIKRVIWAPHFTISHLLKKNKRETLRTSAIFSTFEVNMNFFLNYFKENEEILFCYKPHPLLHKTILESGYMSKSDFNLFHKQLLELKNVFEYDSSDYIGLFANSDALITDCVSFLSEYLPSKKPILFLENQFYSLNYYGKILIENFYKLKGDDFTKIRSFIKNVVILGNDYLYEKRISTLNKLGLITDKTSSTRIINFLNGIINVHQ